MTPPSPSWLSPSALVPIAAAVAAGLFGGGAITAISGALKARAESKRADGVDNREARREAESDLGKALKQIRELRDGHAANLLRIEQLEAAVGDARRREQNCERRVAALHQVVALTAARSRITPEALAADLGAVYDALEDGVVISCARGGGEIWWCNAAFARALGCSREEALDWRRRIDPAHLPATEAVETIASAAAIDDDFVNAYQRPDGRRVFLAWRATRYGADGISIAVARVVEPPEGGGGGAAGRGPAKFTTSA